VVRPERRKRRKLNGGTARSDDESGTEDEEELMEEEIAAPTTADRQRAREKAERLERSQRRRGPSQAEEEEEAAAAEALADGDVEMAEAEEAEAVAENVRNISAERLDLFRERLNVVFEDPAAAAGFIEFGDMLPLINEGLANEDMFGTNEGKAAVQAMAERNELMETEDGTVYKV
jgi:DNA replication licensing factor MCM3